MFAAGLVAGLLVAWVFPTATEQNAVPAGDEGSAKLMVQRGRVASALHPERHGAVNGTITPAISGSALSERGPDTLADMLQLPGDFEQTAALYVRLRGAGVEDVLRLLDEARALPVRDRHAASAILYSRFAELDPDQAVDHALANPSVAGNRALIVVFDAWASIDLDGAIAGVLRLPTRNARTRAGHVVLRALDDHDDATMRRVAADLDMLSAIPDIDRMRRAEQAEQDPYGAWEAALAAAAMGTERSRGLQAVAQVWGRVDPLSALAAIDITIEGKLQRDLRHTVVTVWAQRDPDAALDWVLARPDLPRAVRLATAALRGVANTDPEGALRTADLLADADRRTVRNTLVQGWINDDPVAAEQWLMQSGDDALINKAIPMLATRYAASDPGRGFQWLAELPPESARQAAGTLAVRLAYRDPEFAAAQIADLSDTQTRALASRHLVLNWGQRDPDAAARWVGSRPEAEQMRLNESLAGAWVVRDAEAARAYVDTIVDPVARDAAALFLLSFATPAEFRQSVVDGLSTADGRRRGAAILRVMASEDKRSALQASLDRLRGDG